MKVAVASGKGGTGKTTLAVSLALALAETEKVELLDCDVEEPNVHLFLHPRLVSRESVNKLLPVVDEERCTRCGACVRACEFHALGLLGGSVVVYPQLCHGCGRCGLVCPVEAIADVPQEIGKVEWGTARGLRLGRGILNVGEAAATPIIHALQRGMSSDATIVLDAPPGTGCPTIATLRGADATLLVTEPTPFGLHDLRAAVGVARALGVPVAVIVNRDGVSDRGVESYCRQESLPILLKIPFDREIAASYAAGVPLVDAFPKWKSALLEVFSALVEGLK
ncbi:MAG: ATP-binding protein [Candidatus Bipolaricaulota bacterium]